MCFYFEDWKLKVQSLNWPLKCKFTVDPCGALITRLLVSLVIVMLTSSGLSNLAVLLVVIPEVKASDICLFSESRRRIYLVTLSLFLCPVTDEIWDGFDCCAYT